MVNDLEFSYVKEPCDFEFWSGAKETIAYLTNDEINMIANEVFADRQPVNETDFNDFFWFEDDYIAQILGYKDFEELMNDRGEHNND